MFCHSKFSEVSTQGTINQENNWKGFWDTKRTFFGWHFWNALLKSQLVSNHLIYFKGTLSLNLKLRVQVGNRITNEFTFRVLFNAWTQAYWRPRHGIHSILEVYTVGWYLLAPIGDTCWNPKTNAKYQPQVASHQQTITVHPPEVTKKKWKPGDFQILHILLEEVPISASGYFMWRGYKCMHLIDSKG